MIKCINCYSKNVLFLLEESKYMVINECYSCHNIIHLFIDDYLKNYYSIYIVLNYIKKGENLCPKHCQNYVSFCYNCKQNLCNECLLFHNRAIHSIKTIKQIITPADIEEIELYKKDLLLLKNEINKKVEYNKQKNDIEYNNLLNSLLNIIKIKEIFLNMNINSDGVNAFNIISLKNILNKYNKAEFNLLIKKLNSTSYKDKESDIQYYNNYVFYSITPIIDNSMITTRNNGRVNHVIQLKNGNIVSAHWDFLLVYKINHEEKKLEQIQRININNGSIDHIFEYKKNKILLYDKKMKIVQLSPDNKSFKCLNILDHGRKIIPFTPENLLNNNKKKFLFMATPGGIKIYSYIDDDDNEKIDEENNISDVGEVENELKLLGTFSLDFDYSAIIQINNKICGIYKTRNNVNNHFAVWEINYDFNNDSNFDINKFKLLGIVKNVKSAIGRYSISKINDNYAIIGTMKFNYHSYVPNEESGITIVCLDPVEVIQYIKSDEITSIKCLKNNIILTGGKNLDKNSYCIRQWKYDEERKELLYVGVKNMHSDFINTITDIKDGFFMSCGRDGNIYIVYYQ